MPAPVGRWLVRSVAARLTVRSIAASSGVGQLVAAAAEQLDAVVGHRVVAGRDHDAEVGAGRARSGRPARASARRRRAAPRPRRWSGRRRPPPPASPRWRGGHGRRPRRDVEVPSRSARTPAAARATERASSGVRSALARPRTPSVPKRRPNGACRSALGVLGRLAGLLEPVLLALLDPRVTGEEAGLLEGRTVVGLDLDEGAGDGQAQRAGLTRDAATLEECRRRRTARPSPGSRTAHG